MLAIRLPSEIEERLDSLAKKTGRTKTYYARKAILELIEEMEDTYLALERLENPQKTWKQEDLEAKDLYEEDGYGWATHTAQLLRDKRMSELDFDHIAEELEDMVSSNETQMINRLILVLSHLLKWQFQPNMRGHSWMYTIREQRKRSKIHLRKNPSLKRKLDEILVDAYDIAILEAVKETGLDEKTFPIKCPYSFEQIMDEAFYPE